MITKCFRHFLVISTFKSASSRCKTCPFIHNVEKMSGPKRSMNTTDHYTCTSAYVIYYITCTYCRNLYVGETGGQLGDRFREHLCDAKKKWQGHIQPVARLSNLPNNSKKHTAVCGLSLHLDSSESCKTLEKLFNLSNRHSRSSQYQQVLFIQLICSCFLVILFRPIV